jgi:5-methylthioadenosine/S-adenosylhomocysteine deaminase
MTDVDTILTGRWVVPIVPHETIYNDYAIVIHQGRIKDLLPKQGITRKYQTNHFVELTDHAILPGFVNAHTHSPMILFRGLADDLPLMKWLNNYIWPAEKKWLDETFIADGTQLAIAEMIKNGITCFNEHYFFPEIIAQTAIKAGIRACIGLLIINVATAWAQNEKDALHKGMHIYNEFASHPLITFSLAPHAPYTTTNDILEQVGQFAFEHKLPIHMHVHETAHEIADSLKQYHARPLRRLYDLELLSPRFQCVHMTQVTTDDIDILKATQTQVTHCPKSNLKLASGYCPVQELLDNKINVALGTDSAVSNNNLDMLGEMHTAALIGKAIAEDATAVSAASVLRMATLNGARAIGLDHEIGSIEINKAADLIAIDLNQLTTQPIYNPISQIVYASNNSQVTDVWVAGKRLLENRKLASLHEKAILENAQKWQHRIKNSRKDVS